MSSSDNQNKKVSKRDNYLNWLILRERDYLKSRTAYNDYVSALLGYYEGLDIEDTHKGVATKWYRLLRLEPDNPKLLTHATLPEEIDCVFQLLDWTAILKHVSTTFGATSQVTIIVDPFAGLDKNIEKGLRERLLLEKGPRSLHNFKFISNDKKVTGVDSLNPAQNHIMLDPQDTCGARIFVFSAPYLINDIAINYFAYLNNMIVVAQVRDDFLSRNDGWRMQGWFKKLWNEARVLVVTGGPLPYRKQVGQQTWLFIFQNKFHTVKLFKPSRLYRISGWPIMQQVQSKTTF